MLGPDLDVRTDVHSSDRKDDRDKDHTDRAGGRSVLSLFQQRWLMGLGAGVRVGPQRGLTTVGSEDVDVPTQPVARPDSSRRLARVIQLHDVCAAVVRATLELNPDSTVHNLTAEPPR